jgi:hypothetical protein
MLLVNRISEAELPVGVIAWGRRTDVTSITVCLLARVIAWGRRTDKTERQTGK